MSKITREQLMKLAIDNDFTSAALIDKYMALIHQREQFQELVEAAVAYATWWKDHEYNHVPTNAKRAKAVVAAAQPFLPPPDPHKEWADRLKCAANWIDGQEDYSVVTEIRAVANEIEGAGDK